jgi:inosose dehydratase
VRVACNTVLYTVHQLEGAIQELTDAGYQGIELQPHLTSLLMSDPRMVEPLLASRELRVSAVMVGYLFDDETLRRNRLGVELAQTLGAERLIILPPKPEMADVELFGELVRQLASHSAEAGVGLSIHHHAGTVLDTPDRIAAFLADSGDGTVGLCLDPAHYALFADDEADAAARYAAAVNYVHVKDLARRAGDLGFVPSVNNAQQSFRQPGDGVLDLPGVLEALRSGGYDGWLSVEIENFYRPRVEAIASSRRYLEALAYA